MSSTTAVLPGRPAPARRTTSASRTRLKVTRRGRAVLASLVLIPAIAGGAFIATSLDSADASGASAPAQFRYVTIQPGESLWAVATAVAPNADPRDVISEIVALNQLQDVAVTPGQRVAIPSKYRR